MIVVRDIPDASRGFDANQRLTTATAQAAKDKGYSFVVRYVRRVVPHAFDLDAVEAANILSVGLGLLVVQHVESETSWEPSWDKGRDNGHVAVVETAGAGLPPGATVACDLEGVAHDADPEQVIQYCNRWYDAVKAGGFLPALYVGWHCGLTAEQLYKRLRFQRYWGALNLNADEFPIVRGLCMKQHEEKPGDRPTGISFPIDTDTTMLDKLGGRLTMVVQE